MGYEQNVNKVCRRVGKREDTLPLASLCLGPNEGDEFQPFFFGFESGVIVAIPHGVRHMAWVTPMHGELVTVFIEDLLLGMEVGIAIPASGGEGIIFLLRHVLPVFIEADHIRINVVNRGRFSKIDEVWGVSSRGAHIAFKGHELTFFGEAGLILIQDKEFDVNTLLLIPKALTTFFPVSRKLWASMSSIGKEKGLVQ